MVAVPPTDDAWRHGLSATRTARVRGDRVAKTSSSGPDAQRLGYVRAVDANNVNRERLISDAKARALMRVREGYQPPVPRTAVPVGGEAWRRRSSSACISHGAPGVSVPRRALGAKLATIMAGGALSASATVSEQHLLGPEPRSIPQPGAERKTLERIQHTLKTASRCGTDSPFRELEVENRDHKPRSRRAEASSCPIDLVLHPLNQIRGSWLLGEDSRHRVGSTVVRPRIRGDGSG